MMEKCEKIKYKFTVYITKFVGLWPYKTEYITSFLQLYAFSYMLMSDNIGMQVTFSYNY